MKHGKGFRMKGLRMQAEECAIIDRACAVLDLDRAALISEAALFEATRLGIGYSLTPVAPLTKSWPYMPRRDAPTTVRISTTISRTLAELVAMAAHHIHASEPLYLIGATLAYIGHLQKGFHGTYEDTPEEAAALRAQLAKIKLPRQYESRERISSIE